MKTMYICETCNKQYATEEEALNCEREHFEAEEKIKKLTEEKEQRKREIIELWNSYTKDYGENPISLTNDFWKIFGI